MHLEINDKTIRQPRLYEDWEDIYIKHVLSLYVGARPASPRLCVCVNNLFFTAGTGISASWHHPADGAQYQQKESKKKKRKEEAGKAFFLCLHFPVTNSYFGVIFCDLSPCS